VAVPDAAPSRKVVAKSVTAWLRSSHFRSNEAGLLRSKRAAHVLRGAVSNDGGLGILVGDGQLPHPEPEQIVETYYNFPLSFWRVAFDYQFIINPGYNRDRGPVSVFATTLHGQF
jgi:hypothetical protein